MNRTDKVDRIKFKKFFEENGLKDISYYSFLWENERNFEENYIQNTHAQHDNLIHVYENTAINLLCESKYESDNNSVIEFTFLSEKTFRALAFPRPFILIGQKNSLKNIKALGFRTFSDIIDESYDELEDKDRMKKIEEIILDISKKSKEEIYDMWEKCIEIYEHNRKSIFYHVNSFEDFFKKTFPNEYTVMNAEYFASIERTKKLKSYGNS